MRKEISPDMYNYNKFPGPSFIRVGQLVKSDDIELVLVDNVKDGFQADVFGQRFSEILLKYDYIVGDWGNEQLRLRGFYKESTKDSNFAISRLEDYLKEYCNFGCAYFILENPAPRELVSEEEDVAPAKRRRRRRRKPVKEVTPQLQPQPKDKDPKKRSKRASEPRAKTQHFTIRKKDS